MLANAETDSADIAVEGGIWDHDNLAQTSNPFLSGAFRKAALASHTDGNPDTVVTYGDVYSGSMMRFFKVTRLSIRNLTMKNPVTYCLQMAYVRNIHADFALPPGWTEARNPRYNWPLVWIDGDLDIDSQSFDNLSRREDPSARETIGVGAHTHIENLALSNILQRAAPGGAPVLLRNAGRIDRLRLRDIDAGGAPVLKNAGDIDFVLTEHS